MPGGDRTGPLGMGPMTGRGAGYCADASSVIPQRGFFGRGMQFNRRGVGRGFRNRFFANGLADRAFYSQPQVNSALETEILKEEKLLLQQEIETLDQRLKTLEKEQASGK